MVPRQRETYDEVEPQAAKCDGLIYFNARYYDPATGRFLTEDLSRQGVNWYAYCANDPINRIDANGSESVLAGIDAGLRAMVGVDFGRNEFINAYNAPTPLLSAGWTVAGLGKMAFDMSKAYAAAYIAAELLLPVGESVVRSAGAAVQRGLRPFLNTLSRPETRAGEYGFHVGLESGKAEGARFGTNLIHVGQVPAWTTYSEFVEGAKIGEVPHPYDSYWHIGLGSTEAGTAYAHLYVGNLATSSLPDSSAVGSRYGDYSESGIAVASSSCPTQGVAWLLMPSSMHPIRAKYSDNPPQLNRKVKDIATATKNSQINLYQLTFDATKGLVTLPIFPNLFLTVRNVTGVSYLEDDPGSFGGPGGPQQPDKRIREFPLPDDVHIHPYEIKMPSGILLGPRGFSISPRIGVSYSQLDADLKWF